MTIPASGSPPLLELGIFTTINGLPLTGRGGICSGRGEPPSRKDRPAKGRAIALRYPVAKPDKPEPAAGVSKRERTTPETGPVEEEEDKGKPEWGKTPECSASDRKLFARVGRGRRNGNWCKQQYTHERTCTLKEATSVEPASGVEAAKKGLTTALSKLKAKTGNSDINGTATTLDRKFVAWGLKRTPRTGGPS
jgi:hypothetical protein